MVVIYTVYATFIGIWPIPLYWRSVKGPAPIKALACRMGPRSETPFHALSPPWCLPGCLSTGSTSHALTLQHHIQQMLMCMCSIHEASIQQACHHLICAHFLHRYSAERLCTLVNVLMVWYTCTAELHVLHDLLIVCRGMIRAWLLLSFAVPCSAW